MTEKDKPDRLPPKDSPSSETKKRDEPAQSARDSDEEKKNPVLDEDALADLEESWPLSHVGANLVLALGSQPLSISALSRSTGFNRKAVRNELEVLSGAGWVTEMDNASGPQRSHALTPGGQKLRERLLEVLETCASLNNA